MITNERQYRITKPGRKKFVGDAVEVASLPMIWTRPCHNCTARHMRARQQNSRHS